MAVRLTARLASPGVRLFLIFSLATFVGLGAIAVVLALRVRSDVEHAARSDAATLARALSHTAFGPLLSERGVPEAERMGQFRRAAAAAEASAPVLGVAVVDATGRVVYSTQRAATGRHIDVSVPLKDRGEVIGAARMKLDYAPTTARIRGRLTEIWTIIGGAAVLI